MFTPLDRRTRIPTLFFLLVVVLVLPATGTWAQTEPVAARLQWVTGLVQVVGPAGQRQDAVAGTPLSPGQSVETGAGATAHVLLADGGYVAVRADSGFTLVIYGATAKLDDSMALSLTRGALRVVTGWLAKTSPRSFSLRTSTATVGIRGTDFEVVEDATDTHVMVNSGEVLLGDAQGYADMGPGDMASLRHSDGTISRQSKDDRGAKQVFDRARVAANADAAEDRVNRHAANINQHMESSLREAGLMRADQTLDKVMQNRKEAVERRREQVGTPGKESVVDRMQDARDRALAERPGAPAAADRDRAKEPAAQGPQGGPQGGAGAGGSSRAGGGGGRSGGGGGGRR